MRLTIRRSERGRFRLRTQRVILTYSQISDRFDKDALGPFLLSLEEDSDCIRVAHEHHRDGGSHMHAYVDWGRVRYTTNPLEFDFGGTHPNIKSIRATPWRVYEYVGKEGEILFEHGDPPLPGGKSKSDRDDKWRTCIEAPTKAEFFDKCKETCPRDLVIAFNSISAFADWHYRDPGEQYDAPDIILEGEEVPGILRWAMENLDYDPQRGGSLEIHRMGRNTPPLSTAPHSGR